MRGYGQTDRPEAIDQYTLLHLVGDMVGCSTRSASEQAVIAGHDWGAPVAWHAALLRPDRFRGVVGLSVPYRPRAPVRPTTRHAADRRRYVLSALLPETGRRGGRVRARCARDASAAPVLRLGGRAARGRQRISDRCRRRCGHGAAQRRLSHAHRGAGCAAAVARARPTSISMPASSRARGFRGGLNWYRNIDRNWELLAPFAGQGDRARPLRRRRPRSGGRVSRHGQDDRQSHRLSFRTCAPRSCCRDAGIGLSRNARRRSTPR